MKKLMISLLGFSLLVINFGACSSEGALFSAEGFRSDTELSQSASRLAPYPIDYVVLEPADLDIIESLVGDSIFELHKFFIEIALPAAQFSWDRLSDFENTARFDHIIDGANGVMYLDSEFIYDTFYDYEYYRSSAIISAFQPYENSSLIDGDMGYSYTFDFFDNHEDRTGMNANYVLYDGEFVLGIAYTYDYETNSRKAIVRSGQYEYYCEIDLVTLLASCWEN